MERVRKSYWINKNKNYYNSIPVHYCRNCGSLYILNLDNSSDGYCGECGIIDTGLATIDWIEMHYKRVGRKFFKQNRIKI